MLLLSLILAHLIADFYLQTDEMVKGKRKYIKKHIGHHLLLTLIVLLAFWGRNYLNTSLLENVIFPVLFIVIFHLFIDLLKIKLHNSIKIKNEENTKRVGFFILDQLFHLGVIILCCQFFFGITWTSIYAVFQDDRGISPVNSVLFIMIIVILATSVSGHMIRILLGSLPNQLLTFEGKYAFKQERKEAHFENKRMGEKGISEEYNYTIFSKHDLSRGKLIGYIERLLVLILTFYGSYPAIGFIVAAKSIARFKQMDDRDWAEYFLLGTLTSMLIGIGLGIVLREVLT
jgi:hypothetical protein